MTWKSKCLNIYSRNTIQLLQMTDNPFTVRLISALNNLYVEEKRFTCV